MSGHLEEFMKGWERDDLDMILNACADDFVYDDPIDGRIPKSEFADYYRGLPDGEAEFGDAVSQETANEEASWLWWAWKPKGATQWAQEGSSLAKADADGVHVQRIAYYKR